MSSIPVRVLPYGTIMILYIMNCVISVYLAYGMAIYCLACVYYLVMTRDVGTPFKDTLSQKQLKIKVL